ncbi:hypothetical protein B2K_39400 [Paenibacillus mucilaginosus K02]|uniref:Uncharacterized protein n=1 Tax=Paenibacillus mucilaginosus K02 TaxID=997761 RepID=R9UPE7_9BACL|nr:hypothetical protein B2K_39400 [Paenibacillus mucilaginosus K02]
MMPDGLFYHGKVTWRIDFWGHEEAFLQCPLVLPGKRDYNKREGCGTCNANVCTNLSGHALEQPASRPLEKRFAGPGLRRAAAEMIA